jgi:hypothetical protein
MYAFPIVSKESCRNTTKRKKERKKRRERKEIKKEREGERKALPPLLINVCINHCFLLCISTYFFIVVLGGGTLWHLQKFLQCITYIILEFIPSTAVPYLPSPHSWNSFNKLTGHTS